MPDPHPLVVYCGRTISVHPSTLSGRPFGYRRENKMVPTLVYIFFGGERIWGVCMDSPSPISKCKIGTSGPPLRVWNGRLVAELQSRPVPGASLLAFFSVSPVCMITFFCLLFFFVDSFFFPSLCRGLSPLDNLDRIFCKPIALKEGLSTTPSLILLG